MAEVMTTVTVRTTIAKTRQWARIFSQERAVVVLIPGSALQEAEKTDEGESRIETGPVGFFMEKACVLQVDCYYSLLLLNDYFLRRHNHGPYL